MLRRKLKKPQDVDIPKNDKEPIDKIIVPNSGNDQQDLYGSITVGEKGERTIKSSTSDIKALNYLGAKIISSNNRRRAIRGIRTKAELLNLNSQTESSRDLSHDKSDVKLVSENNQAINLSLKCIKEDTKSQNLSDLPILYPVITLTSQASTEEHSEHFIGREAPKNSSSSKLDKGVDNMELTKKHKYVQRVKFPDDRESVKLCEIQSYNVPILPNKNNRSPDVYEDVDIKNLPPIKRSLSSEFYAENIGYQYSEENAETNRTQQTVLATPTTSNNEINEENKTRTNYSSFQQKNRSPHPTDLGDLPNSNYASADKNKILPCSEKETEIGNVSEHNDETFEVFEAVCCDVETQRKTELINCYIDYDLDDSMDTEHSDINSHKDEVDDKANMAYLQSFKDLDIINTPTVNVSTDKNDDLKQSSSISIVDSDQANLNNATGSCNTRNIDYSDFPKSVDHLVETANYFKETHTEYIGKSGALSEEKSRTPISVHRISVADYSNVIPLNEPQNYKSNIMHPRNHLFRTEQPNVDKKLQDLADDMNKVNLGKDTRADRFHGEAPYQYPNTIPNLNTNQNPNTVTKPNTIPGFNAIPNPNAGSNQNFITYCNQNLSIPSFQSNTIVPSQNPFPFHPMNYQYYNSSNFFPYQYMGPFIPPLIYTHPHDQFRAQFSQTPYFYPPHITPYPNADKYITNPKPPQNVAEPPAIDAYLKWQEDYAKWYRTYHEANTANHSRRDSLYSNRSLTHSILYDNSNVYNDQRSMDDQRSLCDLSHDLPINIKESDNRTTPVLFSTQPAFCNFSAINKAVTYFDKSIDIYSITKKLDNRFLEFPGPLSSEDSTKRNLIKYLKWGLISLENIEPVHKLLWNIFLVIIQANGIPDFCDLAETLLNYNPKLVSSELFNHKTTNNLNEQDHSNITLSLIGNDKSAAVSKAIQANNWGLAFAICLNDSSCLKEVLMKYIGKFDNHDLIRSYLSLQSNVVIDISTLKDFEVVNSWNQHIALFLSQYAKHKDVCGIYINNIAKILQSKGKWEEYYICIILLDLICGVNPSSPPFVDLEILLRKSALDLTPADIIRVRTMEIYEYLSKLKGSNCNCIYLQMLKLSLAEIISFSDEKEKAFRYVHSISKYILSHDIHDYSHAFLSKLLKLSKNLFQVLFQSVKYPDWLTTLNLLDINDLGNPVLGSLSNVFPIPDNCEHEHKIQLVSDQKFHYNLKIISDECEKSITSGDVECITKCVVEEKNQPDSIFSDSIISNLITDTFVNPLVPVVRAQDYPTIQPLPIMVTANSTYVKPIKTETPTNFSNITERDVEKSKESFIDSTPTTETSQKTTLYKDITESDKNADKSNDSGQNRFFSGATKILGKIFKPRDGAFLPDDSNPQIVFDSALNRYVDKSNPIETQSNTALPPPKSIPSINSPKVFSQSDYQPRKNRYVAPTY